MRQRFLRSSLLIATLLSASGFAWAQEAALGRLFFTPQQRANLDTMRQHNVKQGSDPVTAKGMSITVQGVVRRSSGKDTAWVNGAAVSEPAEQLGSTSSPQRRQPTQLGIGERDVRVGDSINQSTGEQNDLLRGGQILIKPGNGKSQ